MFRVKMTLSGKTVQDFVFDQPGITIGRDQTCDILLENIGTSRKHARIEQTGNGFVLADLKSHNGTFVEGRKISRYELKKGDEFYIGKFGFQFEPQNVVEPMEEPPAAAAPAEVDPEDMIPEMTYQLDLNQIQQIKHRSAQGNAIQLVQIRPRRAQQVAHLDAPYYVMGSDLDAAFLVGGFLAPKKVAVLVRAEHGYHVLGLTPRFKVNGKSVNDHPLENGDVLSFGSSEFRYRSP